MKVANQVFQYNFLTNFVFRIPFEVANLTSIDYKKLAEFAKQNKEALYFSSYALYQELFSDSEIERLLNENEKKQETNV